MELHVYFGWTDGVFALPCAVVDQYLNSAPENALRLLLYLYRYGGKVESKQICTALHISEKTLMSILAFWADKQIISFNEQGKKVALRETAAQEDFSAPRSEKGVSKPKTSAIKKRLPIEAPPHYSAGEISRRTNESEEIRFLLETAPTMLGHLLSPTECSMFLSFHDDAGLPVDVILMLLEYCISNGHSNLRYLQKVAFAWAEDGIDTYERAEMRIRSLEKLHGYEGKVRSITGVTDRAFNSVEKQHLSRWANEWDTPLELVRGAFDICVQNTGKLSFAYMNKILKTWHEKGFKTLEQTKNERRGRVEQANKASTYDMNEYVDLSMKRLMGDKK